MASSSEDDPEGVSTSSDEDIRLSNRRSRKKRDRKNYRPEGETVTISAPASAALKSRLDDM